MATTFRRADFVNINGELVRKALAKKGLNLSYVEKIMGCRDQTLSNWTRRGRMDGKYVDQLCVICDISKEELLNNRTGIGVPEKKPEVVKEEVKAESKAEEKIEPIKLEAQVVPQTDISKMFERVMDLQMKHLEAEREANKELREMLKTAIDALNDVAGRDTAALSEITIEAVNDDFRLWKQNVLRCANKVISLNKDFKSTNSVLSEAYKLLRNQYGVVWEQEKKDFLDKNGRSPVSTLELQYWIEATKPQNKNLLIAKLDTLCHKDYYGKTRS